VNNIAIKDLSIVENKEYTMTVSHVLITNMLVVLNGIYYMIAIPKNTSWQNIKLFDGLVCRVKKAKYGNNNEFYRLDLIKIKNKNDNITVVSNAEVLSSVKSIAIEKKN